MTSLILNSLSTTAATISGTDFAIIGLDGMLAVDGNALSSTATSTSITIMGAIASANGNAVFHNGGGVFMSISGTVSARSDTISLLTAGSGEVYNSGTIISSLEDGIDLRSNTESYAIFGITNTGAINAYSDAIVLGALAHSATILNSGTLTGNTGYAIALDVNGGTTYGRVSIQNTGVMQGGSGALNSPFNAVDLSNTGTMIGTIRLGSAADVVTNGGHIMGDVFLRDGTNEFDNRGGILHGNLDSGLDADIVDNRDGAIYGNLTLGDGNDTLDSRGGRIDGNADLGLGNDSYDGRGAFVTGTVFGGDGADTFIGNAGAEDIFDGGSDSARDTLDFRTQAAVVVALDGLFDTDGSAAGDTYIGFENIYGSARGADVLRGSSAANTLLGFGGDDAIDGAEGNDILRGDGGIDTMTGGLGNDVFRFVSITDIGDAITDFHNVAGDNDRIEIRAAGFGGGLVAGALPATAFVSRADNLAQDADDRFIFRTTDRTLWFDDDGTGSHAAVMVADLQAGATFTAADILIV